MATLASRTALPTETNRFAPALSARTALAIIAVAVLLFRLGFLWPEQIDWDEWTFILMGGDVAQGNLPFVHLFDLKPPLIFLLMGGTIALFGKSLLAIRMLGAICLFVAAAFVFVTGRRMVGSWPALAGALLTVALASAPFGLATNTELLAIALLSGATWRLVRAPLPDRDAAIAGALVALAVLSRTNLALVALVVGLLLLVAGMLPRNRVSRLSWIAFGIGGLVPAILLTLAYAAAGALPTLKLAMIDAPLAYSVQQLGMLEVARSHVMQFYYTAQGAPLLYGPPLLLAVLGAGFMLRAVTFRRETVHVWPLAVLVALTGAVAGSLLIGGAAFPHYWVQLVPFAGLFAALGVAGLVTARRRLTLVAAGLVLLPCATSLAASLSALPANYAAPPHIQLAAAHIRASGGAEPTVWALHKHLVLWYLDAPQLSRAGVHPDSLARRAIIDTLSAQGYVGPDELGRVMRLQPDFVVTDAGGKGLAWVRADGRQVDAWLAANYRQDARFGDVLVYRHR